MRRIVWATWFYYMSTDTTPQHFLCSVKWCKFLKAMESADTYTHRANLHKNNLPEDLLLAIKSTFMVLAAPELLKRCLHGKTQNPNESFNALIWGRCPKTVFVSNLVVKIAAFDAAAIFNDGSLARLHFLRRQGFRLGVFTEQILRSVDEQRNAKAEASMQTIHQAARQRSRGYKKAV
ncbi:uncharacterized protein [Anabrus simplex]|uniref:uncharacterized protein n=1 Tax=Anabrus simplex TaxID=316456 RepID=UPI0035A2E16D